MDLESVETLTELGFHDADLIGCDTATILRNLRMFLDVCSPADMPAMGVMLRGALAFSEVKAPEITPGIQGLLDEMKSRLRMN